MDVTHLPVNVLPKMRSWLGTSCFGVMVSVMLSCDGSIPGSLEMGSSSRSSCCRSLDGVEKALYFDDRWEDSGFGSERGHRVRSNRGRSIMLSRQH
jgi:hypothetical protein